MEKINIAEILKDCPKGMELDCAMWDNLYFDRVEKNLIHCYYESDGYRNTTFFCKNGCYTAHKVSKCVIFPKGKTTWEGFHRPFKNGDVVTSSAGCIAIFSNLQKDDIIVFHCCYGKNIGLVVEKGCGIGNSNNCRLADEEEKQKLFDAIKANGYKWNTETKTLEKLPKFKEGDRITNGKVSIIIDHIDDNYYYEIGRSTANRLLIKNQDDWRLDKFDIATLKPFDKVLVRCNSLERWNIQFFEKYNRELGAKYPFICLCGNKYSQCVPYEGNEYLLDTTCNCNDYFKTWK